MSEDNRITLLKAFDATGKSGVAWALEKGHPEAIDAFVKIVNQLLSPNEATALLADLCDKQAVTLFNMSIQNGNAAVMGAFGKLVAQLPVERQAELLIGAAENALRPAIKHGHYDAINAYVEIAIALAKNLHPAQRNNLLEACRAAQGSRRLGRVANDKYYNELKDKAPFIYQKFSAMKDLLKPQG